MHPSVHAWVTAKADEHRLRDRSCLDVGCYATDYLKVRDIFTNYRGVDSRPGPNVDAVMDGEALMFAPNSFDVVVSTEVLEHCERPWRFVDELARVTRDYVLLTARGYDERGVYPVHEHPVDYWRFSVGAMVILAETAGLCIVEAVPDPEFPGAFILARKS